MIAIVSILAITFIVITGMLQGIDGLLYTTGLGLISGLGGYKILGSLKPMVGKVKRIRKVLHGL